MSFTAEKLDLLRRTITKGATQEQHETFVHICERTELDPFARQIYFQLRKNSKTGLMDMTILTGIDGYRLIADRTERYAGNDDPVFDNEENPRRATVTVYKLIGGVRCPFTASARWDAYYPGDYQGRMWQKMPHLMLGKCAEGLALRKAFPAELSGVYVKEELDQAGKPMIGEDPEDEELPPPPKQPRGAPVKTSKPDPKEMHQGATNAALEAGKAAAQKILDDEAKKKQILAVYNNTIPDQQKRLAAFLEKEKLDPALWEEVGAALHGKPMKDVKIAIKEVLAQH